MYLIKILLNNHTWAVILSVWGMVQVQAMASSPAAIYDRHCAVCHGDRGDGQTRARFGLNPPPRDFTTVLAANELTRERMIASVAHGREGTAMVAWQNRLSDEDIAAVVDYIRGEFMMAQGHEPLPQPSEAQLRLSRGLLHYQRHCRVCHGDNGNGSTWTITVLEPSPRNFTSPQSRRLLTREGMIGAVTHGRAGTAMMGFAGRLTADEIGEVVDYIRETFMTGPVIADAGVEASAAPAHGGHGSMAGGFGGAAMAPRFGGGDVLAVDMDAPFPGELAGDFEKGRQFYMANCSTCHGVRGDGYGPRSSFIVPPPRNFLHPEARAVLNRPGLFRAIVIGKPGTPMPAWGKVLGPQQVADVAEFVFQDFIRPPPGGDADGDKKKAD